MGLPALLLSIALGATSAAPSLAARDVAELPALSHALPAESATAALVDAAPAVEPNVSGKYFGARYYGSKIGRFTTTDPVYTWQENLLDPQRWNRYAYARNNPLRYVDPDGRELRTIAQETVSAIAGDAASRVVIRNGVVDTSALTSTDLSGNEGAVLLNQMATSKFVYTYTEAATKGGVQNLDNRPDWRYGKGKGPGDLPPAGVDAAVTIDPSARYVDAATGTKSVSRPAIAVHELAEAYAKVDKGMPYVPKGGGAGAHEDARQRERTLIGQRPGFTQFPAGETVKRQNP